MGIPGSFKVDKHGTIHEYTWHGEDMRGTIYEEKPEADDAKYRIPKGEASQLYELRRLFRL